MAYLQNSGKRVLNCSTRAAEGSESGITFAPSYRLNHRRGSPDDDRAIIKNLVAGEGGVRAVTRRPP
jgi:hypothetical protein